MIIKVLAPFAAYSYEENRLDSSGYPIARDVKAQKELENFARKWASDTVDRLVVNPNISEEQRKKFLKVFSHYEKDFSLNYESFAHYNEDVVRLHEIVPLKNFHNMLAENDGGSRSVDTVLREIRSALELMDGADDISPIRNYAVTYAGEKTKELIVEGMSEVIRPRITNVFIASPIDRKREVCAVVTMD